MRIRKEILIASILFALALLPLLAPAQTHILTPGATASVSGSYGGGGVIMAGDVWDSFLPQGYGPSYSDASAYLTLGTRVFVRMGNFDRSWTTPQTHWPSGYPLTPYWYKNVGVYVYDPDSTFNPATIGGAANPSYFAVSKNPAGNFSNYAQLTYRGTLNGAGDIARHYYVEPYWVDGNRRQHVVYEAAWPTNVGIDVKMRAHGFSGPNWDNLNDYVIIETQLKNTGFLDMDMNGTAEKTSNQIKALVLAITGESYMSVSSYACGGRCVNDIVPAIFARQASWIDDPDPDGSPWAFEFVHTASTVQNPGAGQHDFGLNGGVTKNYTDIYTGWVMLDAKSGPLPSDPSQTVVNLPTKQTIFGTHPVGVGAQRGWYLSSGSNPFVFGTSDPRKQFIAYNGVWYNDGGRNSHNADINVYNLNPSSNFFSAGTTEDVTTFVPKASPSRPTGDFKSTGTFEMASDEDGHADATTLYPTGFGKWTLGASNTENFDGDNFTGIGPFSIPKDSTITIVFATVAGYRLEGIQKAVRAARWAYQNNFALPVLPPLPDMKVSNTLAKSENIEWDTRAESDAGFGGYKIWRSSQYKKLAYLDEGMRVVDRYQEQDAVGPRPSNVYKPVNPKFDGFAKVNSTTLKGTYQPDTWGTWDLLKVIPKSDLANYAHAVSSGYKYLYEDKDVILGFTYWYYVSAYKDGSFTGPGGETTTRIETHSTNRNGATGLWNLTYPYGFNNALYPKDAASLKNVGAAQVVTSALAKKGDVSQVGVRPNPYKRAALHDNRTLVYDHKLLFYNLPPQAKITILDVSGQVIDVINFGSSDPSKGSVFWDMFSKDGVEVASGVYIYVVESPTGRQVGHFAILR